MLSPVGTERPGTPFPIAPPIEPMLATLADDPARRRRLPLRAQVGRIPRDRLSRRRSDVYIQSRDLKPLDRYFPELHEALLDQLPEDCVVDGEIVIATPHGLDFDALQLRLHPAASRVAKLAKETPASFVAFDLLAADGRDLMAAPQRERRARARAAAARASAPPLYLTPMTRDRDTAARWLEQFEGAGLDGVIAKPADSPYQPGKRAMIKVKHARTADCVVAGFRWHKSGQGRGRLAAPRTLRRARRAAARRRDVVVHAWRSASSWCEELAPLREGRARGSSLARLGGGGRAARSSRMPGAQSRWSAGKDLSWEPLRVERVCEVKYDHLQGDRFRHAAVFLRWRPDKRPRGLPLRPARGHAALRAGQGLLVRIQRLLSRPQLGRHVLQVDPDPGPGRGAAAHRVHQHVRRLEVRRRLGVARLPALEPGERVLLAPRAADLDQRMLRRARAVDGCTRGGSPCLLPVVRRPRRVAQALALVPRRQLEQRLERAGVVVDARVPDRRSPAKRAGMVASVKSPGSQLVHLVPARAAPTRARRASGRTE